MREAVFLRDGKTLLSITLILVLCLLARQSHAYVKVLTAPGHPLALILDQEDNIIRKAFLRSPEGVRPLKQIEEHTLLFDSYVFLNADSDFVDDLVWKVDLRKLKSEETVSLWITSVTEASTVWLALAPAGSSLWEIFPALPNGREDVFLYVAPQLPEYRAFGKKSGPETLTFIYTMRLTKNGPKLAAVPEIYTKLLPLAALVRKAQEDEVLEEAYGELFNDFNRMACGNMPSREAINNFLWKRILTVRWKR